VILLQVLKIKSNVTLTILSGAFLTWGNINMENTGTEKKNLYRNSIINEGKL
jgi:hypothetical protein